MRPLLSRARAGPGGTELLAVAPEAVLGSTRLSCGRRAGRGLSATPGSTKLLTVSFACVLGRARLGWSAWRFMDGVSRFLGRRLGSRRLLVRRRNGGRTLRSRLLGDARRVGWQWCSGSRGVSHAPCAHPTVFAALIDSVNGSVLLSWVLFECINE